MLSNWSEGWSQFNGLIDKKDIVIRDVRIQSNAGWYVGAVEFYNFEEMDFYSKDSGYYPNEAMLKEEYPNSISIDEAFHKIKNEPLLKRRMERKLGHPLNA